MLQGSAVVSVSVVRLWSASTLSFISRDGSCLCRMTQNTLLWLCRNPSQYRHLMSLFVLLGTHRNSLQPDSSWSCLYHLPAHSSPKSCTNCLLATFLNSQQNLCLPVSETPGTTRDAKSFIFWFPYWSSGSHLLLANLENVLYLLTIPSLLQITFSKVSTSSSFTLQRPYHSYLYDSPAACMGEEK